MASSSRTRLSALPQPRMRRSIKSDWIERPIGPSSSQSRLSVIPIPCDSAEVRDSRPTHSPTGRRLTWIVRSGLMNNQSPTER